LSRKNEKAGRSGSKKSAGPPRKVIEPKSLNTGDAFWWGGIQQNPNQEGQRIPEATRSRSKKVRISVWVMLPGVERGNKRKKKKKKKKKFANRGGRISKKAANLR